MDLCHEAHAFISVVTRLSVAAGRQQENGGQSEWVVIPTGALMTSAHWGRLLNGHSHCSVAVYLLFSVVQPDFLQRRRRLLAVSVLLWEFMPRLEMQNAGMINTILSALPGPADSFSFFGTKPHTEKSTTLPCHIDKCLHDSYLNFQQFSFMKILFSFFFFFLFFYLMLRAVCARWMYTWSHADWCEV